MASVDPTKLLTVFDRYTAAVKRLDDNLDNFIPSGCRIEVVDDLTITRFESAREALATLGMPWTVVGRSIDSTHVSVICADGTKALHDVRKVIVTVEVGLIRIIKQPKAAPS